MRLAPLVLILSALGAGETLAQAPASRSPAGTTLSGVVRDSVAHAPLAGAMVQLVAADGQARAARSAVADSLGRYRIDSVPDGRYHLGFFHPVLDSLGVEPPVREITVAGGTSLRTDIATPAPRQLRGAICGAGAVGDSNAVVVGTVRDARQGTPMPGVSVIGEWLEYSITPTGLQRRMPRLVATTGENGWFALCNVPSAGTIVLLAAKGADSTDMLEVDVPGEGFARRELYLGPAVTTLIGNAAQRTDSLAPKPRRMRTGNGRLSGRVTAAVGGKPLGGAFVGITDGPQTHTDENGDFTIVNAPAGTRALEVRALGYFPARRRVDVVSGAPPVHVALSTVRAMLDTVKITANRQHTRNIEAFLERRTSGMGRFITAEDIARRGAFATSDVFKNVPGLQLQTSTEGGRRLLMRGVFAQSCSPAMYLDGHYMGGLASDGGGTPTIDADTIDDWITPSRIAGIEIYVQGTVPPQFQQGLSDCGSIVIWSK